MSASTAFASWAARREAKKAERWHKNVRRIEKKSPPTGRDHLYIRLYFIGIAVGLVALLASTFNFLAILLWLVGSLIIVVAWVMLRWSIRLKDDAPLEVLDEYEAATVNSWRKIAYGFSTAASTVFALILVFFSTRYMNNADALILGNDTMRWVYWITLLYLTVLLAITALPAIGYSITFADDPDEEAEDEPTRLAHSGSQ